MKVNKTIETPQGTVQFQGELNPEEVDLVMAAGLNFLIGQGDIPFRVLQASEMVNMTDGSETEQ